MFGTEMETDCSRLGFLLTPFLVMVVGDLQPKLFCMWSQHTLIPVGWPLLLLMVLCFAVLTVVMKPFTYQRVT